MDHDDLDDLLDALFASFRSGDWAMASETYAEFEARLTRHLAVEEEMLFPEFAKFDPYETDELRHSHDAIRARVFALGVGIDVHQTRLPAVQDLVDMLHRHADRENALLYRWADREVPDTLSQPTFFESVR